MIRLADIGGDKQVPYLAPGPESNPFLGVRGSGSPARHRDLLVTQIRAISGRGRDADVVPHVMAPMVATIEDVDLFHGLVGEAQPLARRSGARSIVTGIMVEMPAAALLAPELAPRVDFFSIGTNDLTQYVMAADRTNRDTGRRQDALHPACPARRRARGARRGCRRDSRRGLRRGWPATRPGRWSSSASASTSSRPKRARSTRSAHTSRS